MRKELLQLARACGEPHPSFVPLQRLELIEGFDTGSARERFGYDPAWRMLSEADGQALRALMTEPSAMPPMAAVTAHAQDVVAAQ